MFFDSHIDNFLTIGVDVTLMALIYRLPDLQIKYIVLRPSTYVLMRELEPNTLIYLAIPNAVAVK